MAYSIERERARAKTPQRMAYRLEYRNRPDVKSRERRMRFVRMARKHTKAEWQAFEQRFWSKAVADGDCLVWMANRNARGYGMVGQFSKMRSAHRVAWELANKQKIPTGLFVLHHCDNPPCVKPEHLFLGTSTDNMLDMARKGRGGKAKGLRNGAYTHPEQRPRGASNGQSKLTIYDVRRIRSIYIPRKYSARRIAREYGLHRDTIEKVLRRKNWAWA